MCRTMFTPSPGRGTVTAGCASWARPADRVRCRRSDAGPRRTRSKDSLMTTFSRTLSQAISEQHGVVSAAQLAADGVERDGRRRLVTAGTLVAVHQGVY